MTLRYLAAFCMLCAAAVLSAEEDASRSPREALRPFNDLIGPWRATGEPATGTLADKQKGFWSEKISWTWKFKGDDAWLVMEITNGKHFRGGELRYLPEKQMFQLTLFPVTDDKPRVYYGNYDAKTRTLVVERSDAQRKVDERVTINLVDDIRFVFRYDYRPMGRKLYVRDFIVGATKEGQALAVERKKGPECVVSGGLGTIPVSYKGQTYYVCCTGCRDAFNENPEKYIKEYLERKAKEQRP
ncbi:MAG: YHS domain-containing protein [Gemmatales bacterium]|nr:YHS domain-containing protein [Gemmatales bacterium]MDW7994696.1 YHS domain-containing protein [Gemmatales bacterium]